MATQSRLGHGRNRARCEQPIEQRRDVGRCCLRICQEWRDLAAAGVHQAVECAQQHDVRSFPALSGDTLAVGAKSRAVAQPDRWKQADTSATDAGAAYVFKRSSGAWAQQAYVKASNTGAGDNFGATVALDGDQLIVGAPGEDSAATGVNGISRITRSVAWAPRTCSGGMHHVGAKGLYQAFEFMHRLRVRRGGDFGERDASWSATGVSVSGQPCAHGRVPCVPLRGRLGQSGHQPGTTRIQEDARVTSAPALVTWSATDNRSAAWQLRHDLDIRHHTSLGWGAWQALARGVVATNLQTPLTLGKQYQIRVRTRDEASNLGAWVMSNPITVETKQETQFTLKGAWTANSDPQAMGKHVVYSHAEGANARLEVQRHWRQCRHADGQPNRAAGQDLCRQEHFVRTVPADRSDDAAGQSRTVIAVFDGLVPGNHTLDVTVKSGTVILDGAIVWK